MFCVIKPAYSTAFVTKKTKGSQSIQLMPSYKYPANIRQYKLSARPTIKPKSANVILRAKKMKGKHAFFLNKRTEQRSLRC